MSLKIKFKPKTKKGAKKRLSLTHPKDSTQAKLVVSRINNAHRMINKQSERKLKSRRKTTLTKLANKYKAFI